MSPRPTLVATSLVVHLAIVLALFIAGFWKLDRLDAPRHRVDLAVAPPPPPAPAGSPAGAKVKLERKQPKHVTHDIVIAPKPEPEEPPTAAAEIPGDGEGSGSGTGSGSGSGDPDSTGDCTGEGCGESTTEPAKKQPIVEREVFVPPTVIKRMRIAGETQIQPPDNEKTALLRSGHPRAAATVKVCVGSTGDVASLSFVKSSGYAGWDAAIMRAIRDWRYKPHRVGNLPVAVCGMVTFLYAIK